MPTKQGGRALKNASTSDRCPPQYCLASCINPVQLEDTLGDVQTDCGNLHSGRLLQLVALNVPSLAHRCRQGSSTASDFYFTGSATSESYTLSLHDAAPTS